MLPIGTGSIRWPVVTDFGLDCWPSFHEAMPKKPPAPVCCGSGAVDAVLPGICQPIAALDGTAGRKTSGLPRLEELSLLLPPLQWLQ